jgi:hypothetical protein
MPIAKSFDATECVTLPDPEPFELSVGEALRRRRSRRDYVLRPLPGAQLATMLHVAGGITGRTQGYGYKRLPLRTFPSSGDLQVPEIYVAIQSVDAAAPGLYHYRPVDGALELLRPGSHGRFCGWLVSSSRSSKGRPR